MKKIFKYAVLFAVFISEIFISSASELNNSPINREIVRYTPHPLVPYTHRYLNSADHEKSIENMKTDDFFKKAKKSICNYYNIESDLLGEATAHEASKKIERIINNDLIAVISEWKIRKEEKLIHLIFLGNVHENTLSNECLEKKIEELFPSNITFDISLTENAYFFSFLFHKKIDSIKYALSKNQNLETAKSLQEEKRLEIFCEDQSPVRNLKNFLLKKSKKSQTIDPSTNQLLKVLETAGINLVDALTPYYSTNPIEIFSYFSEGLKWFPSHQYHTTTFPSNYRDKNYITNMEELEMVARDSHMVREILNLVEKNLIDKENKSASCQDPTLIIVNLGLAHLNNQLKILSNALDITPTLTLFFSPAGFTSEKKCIEKQYKDRDIWACIEKSKKAKKLLQLSHPTHSLSPKSSTKNS